MNDFHICELHEKRICKKIEEKRSFLVLGGSKFRSLKYLLKESWWVVQFEG